MFVVTDRSRICNRSLMNCSVRTPKSVSTNLFTYNTTMEVDDCGMKSQDITKQDLQVLAKVTYRWSGTNFQVIELEELRQVKLNRGERITLIINVKNQWNTLIVDGNNKPYLGYTDTAIKYTLEHQLTAKELKKPHVTKINNNGLSALINATVINNLLDNSQTVISKFVKQLDPAEMRLALNQCLMMIRGINDKFKSSHNHCLKSIQENPPSGKKAGTLNSSPPVEAAKQAIKRTCGNLQESPVTPQKISKPSPVGDGAGFNLSPRVVIRNKEPMSYPQMKDVLDRIIHAIYLLGEDVAAPQFLGHTFENGGSVIITCKNPASMQWLLERVPRLHPWPGAELATKPESELLAGAVFKTYIPEKEIVQMADSSLKSVDFVEIILHLIKKQNPELNSEQWWVLKGTKAKKGFNVTVALNATCAQALRKIKLTVAIGVTSIKFHSLNNRGMPKHLKFSSPVADKMRDLQLESESPNKTASPRVNRKAGTFKTAQNPGPSVGNKQPGETGETALDSDQFTIDIKLFKTMLDNFLRNM